MKFTIPLLNPKIGDYELEVTVAGPIDSAGNVRTERQPWNARLPRT